MTNSNQSDSESLSPEFYRNLYHLTPANMHCTNAKGLIEFVSDSWCEFLGYKHEEVIGQSSIDFLTDASRQFVMQVAAQAFLAEGSVSNLPIQYQKKNGDAVDVLLSSKAEFDSDGNFVRAMSVIVDVSEQREVEEQVGRKLIQLERLTTVATGLSRVFSELPDNGVKIGLTELVSKVFPAEYVGVGIANDAVGFQCSLLNTNAGGHISQMRIGQDAITCQFWKKLFQKRRAVVEGEGIVLPNSDRHTYFALGTSMNQTDRLVGIVFLMKSGEPYSTDDFDLMERLSFLLAPMIRTHIELQRQRAQRFEAERRNQIQQRALEHSSRLNAMGEMAGGLAHELNQPLTAIANFIDSSRQRLLSDQNEKMKEASALLDKAEEQVFRAASIVKNVRRFVSKSEPSREDFDINQLISETIDLLKADVRLEAVEVSFLPEEQELTVSADRLQIQQVLVNLVQNAVEAVEEMPEKRVRISTRHNSRGMCEISIEDSGEGFPEENVSYLFSSMYTTKTRGLGMGLSICRTIVESHGGSIDAKNRDPHGAKFTFSIPTKSA